MVLENQMQTMWNELGFCFVCGKNLQVFFSCVWLAYEERFIEQIQSSLSIDVTLNNNSRWLEWFLFIWKNELI